MLLKVKFQFLSADLKKNPLVLNFMKIRPVCEPTCFIRMDGWMDKWTDS